MKRELEEQFLLLTLEERLAANRKQLELIEGLLRQEYEKPPGDRKYNLMIFLGAERRVYTAIIGELEGIRSQRRETSGTESCALLPSRTA